MLSQSIEVARFSHTILGKLIAICIIIYYTIIDKLYGIISCVLILFYYQSDYIENILNINNIIEDIADTVNLNTSYKPLTEPLTCNQLNTENMHTIEELYNADIKVDKSIDDTNNSKFYKDFKIQYCDGNTLKYKNMEVKNDMIQHVFPELKYNNSKCNPCDNKCKFSIIENRIKPHNYK